MKKAKKLLSVFLAALMVMTTLGGVMTASAMSNAEAATAAEAFNATRPDHSCPVGTTRTPQISSGASPPAMPMSFLRFPALL